MPPKNYYKSVNSKLLNALNELEDELMAEEFVSYIEQKAAELEVTCDYYIAEFM